MIKNLSLLLLLLLPFMGSAQTQGPEMADNFRAEGKIYIVLAVVAIVFVCLAAFMVYLERKVSKLEKENGSSSKDASPRH